MSEIRFNNNNEYFHKLVNKAKEFAVDGSVSEIEYKDLEKISESDNTITRDEKLFLIGLKNEQNIKNLPQGTLPSIDFVFDVSLELNNKEEYKKNEYSSKVIPGERVRDIGESVFDKTFFDKKITESQLVSSVLKSQKIINSPIKAKIEEFLKLFKNDKEALIYIKELVNRKPELSEKNLKNIIDKLQNMMKEDYDSRIISNRNLIVSTLHDISAPSDISQNNIGSCAGTSVQIQLALKEPEEYLNVIDTIAKNKSYKSKSGEEIPPNWTFVNEGSGKNNTYRTLSSKIVQNAFMDFANGKYADYDSSGHTTTGLYSGQQEKLLKGIFASEYTSYENDRFTGDQLVSIIEKEKPSASNPVYISMSYDPGGRDSFHAVNVISLDKTKKEATIINPWGREETFPIKELKSRLFSVTASKDLDVNIKKLSESEIKELLNSPDFESKLNSPDFVKILDSLKLEGHVKLVKKLVESDGTEKNKKEILMTLNHLFEGDPAKASNIIPTVLGYFDINNMDLVKTLGEIKSNDPSFGNLTEKIFIAVNTFQDSYKNKILGLLELMDSERIQIILNNTRSDDKILTIIRTVDGDKLAKDQGIAITCISTLVSSYLYGEKASVDELINFTEKVNKSCPDKNLVADLFLHFEDSNKSLLKKGGEKAQQYINILEKMKSSKKN